MLTIKIIKYKNLLYTFNIIINSIINNIINTIFNNTPTIFISSSFIITINFTIIFFTITCFIISRLKKIILIIIIIIIF